MRHARPEALDALKDILQALRQHDALTERKRGTFYRKSSAFLHFHEDPAGLFADLKLSDAFQRFEVTTDVQRRHLLDLVDAVLTPPPTLPLSSQGEGAGGKVAPASVPTSTSPTQSVKLSIVHSPSPYPRREGRATAGVRSRAILYKLTVY
jgi:hypothetical protein